MSKLFDFEGSGSPLEPFDIITLNYDSVRFLPSLVNDGTWFKWRHAQDYKPDPHGTIYDFSKDESNFSALSIEQFLGEIPEVLVSKMSMGSEDSFAAYLQGAATVCYDRLNELAATVSVMTPNSLPNPDQRESKFDQIIGVRRQLHTIVNTAWSFFNLARRISGDGFYNVLPTFGEQFHVSEPYQMDPPDGEWECQVTCLWEPDEDMYARHEMAYGPTVQDARRNANTLRLRLEAEWQGKRNEVPA